MPLASLLMLLRSKGVAGVAVVSSVQRPVPSVARRRTLKVYSVLLASDSILCS